MSFPRTKATVRPSGDQEGCEALSGSTTRIPVEGDTSASRPLAAAAIVGVVAGAFKKAAWAEGATNAVSAATPQSPAAPSLEVTRNTPTRYLSVLTASTPNRRSGGKCAW